jgi:hypothetical protein
VPAPARADAVQGEETGTSRRSGPTIEPVTLVSMAGRPKVPRLEAPSLEAARLEAPGLETPRLETPRWQELAASARRPEVESEAGGWRTPPLASRPATTIVHSAEGRFERASPKGAERTVVHVSIDRVEIRAVPPPPPQPVRRARRVEPALSLTDYLERRKRGQ